MNGNNHLVEDSVGRNDTSPHPRFRTQALLQLLLLYVLLWSVSMGFVITVANVEVQIPPPVPYLCCFTISASALDDTLHTSTRKPAFQNRIFPDFASLWRKSVED